MTTNECPIVGMRMIRKASYDGCMSDTVRVYQVNESQWTRRNDIAIHLLNPTETELELAMDDAAAKGFEKIIVYGLFTEEES